MEDNKTDCFVDVLTVIAPFLPSLQLVLGNYDPKMKDAVASVFPGAKYEGRNEDYITVGD